MMVRSIYREWPDQQLADELFAMRRAVEERPEEAHRWAARLEQAEREAKRRTPRRPRRYREPIGQRIAILLVGDRDATAQWVDWEPGARLVVVDDLGHHWGCGPGDRAHRLNIFRRGHLACIMRTRRSGVFIATEWEYPDDASPNSQTTAPAQGVGGRDQRSRTG